MIKKVYYGEKINDYAYMKLIDRINEIIDQLNNLEYQLKDIRVTLGNIKRKNNLF